MGNSRITVLLGAGAMCECTPLTTRYLTDLVAEKEQDYLDEASRRIKTYPLLSEIKTDLENYFHKDEVVSFEDMLHALEMLHSYESANNIGTVKEFKSVFPMFSKLQENYEEKLPHVFAAQNDLISTLVDEIAKYEGGWNNSSNAWFTKFFRQISEHSKIDFYSLNYDTWLEQIFEGQYADGFTKLDEEYNLFSPRAVFNFDDELHSINHLHGQICFTSYPRQYRNRYTWEQPCGFVKANNIGIVQRRGEYPRQSQVLCKPSMWCRIEAPHRRFLIWPEEIAVPKKTSADQKSVSCCKRATLAAWTTSKTCLRRPLPNSWKMVWMQS